MSYGTADEALAATVPFLRRGLDRGEQCIVVSDADSRPAILDAMRSRDIAVDERLANGALSLIGTADSYRMDGQFDPDRTLAWLRDRARAARAGGFSALRIVGDMICIAQAGALDVQQLAEYEANGDGY